MAAFNQEIMSEVVAACQAGAGEAGQAISRALDQPFQLKVGDAGVCRWEELPPELSGPGLLVVMRVGAESAILAIPATQGVVPAWCAAPDVTGKGKLATLAVELGMLLLPEAFSAMDGTAAQVRDLPAALRRAAVPAEAGRVILTLSLGDKSVPTWLVWPAARADDALAEPAVAPAPSEAPAKEVASTGPAKRVLKYEELEDGIQQLPSYSRSLLKIKVPVMVTLAESKQSIETVMEIGPGSIIHFNKGCEDTLTLEVAGQRVAAGEAVKVGDKFGLWITSMILPDERFWVISNRLTAERAQ